MSDLQALPIPRELPAQRHEAARRQLEVLVGARSRRQRAWRWLNLLGWRGRAVGALVVVAVLGSALTAVALVVTKPVTFGGGARCYTVDSLGDSVTFSGTSIAEAGPSGGPAPSMQAQYATALDVCAALWQQGFLTAGSRSARPPADLSNPATNNFPVPPLVACRLPGGAPGVFPGERTTCAKLGLQPFRQSTPSHS